LSGFVNHAYTVVTAGCRHGERAVVNVDLLMILVLAALVALTAAYVAALTRL
jgi:hypothetical protein